MSFQGPDPYGTPGGTEVVTLPQTPEDVRIAKGRSYIIFMRTNGPVTTRFREQVEDVIRVLGLTGNVLVAIIVRENNVVRDANAGDLNFSTPLTATELAPGVVSIDIGPATITVFELADDAVETAKIKNAAVTAAKLAPGVIVPSGLVPLVQQAFGPAAVFNRDGIFSATYDSYYISLSNILLSSSANVHIRLRSGGVDIATNTYDISGYRVADTGTGGIENFNNSSVWVYPGTAAVWFDGSIDMWITNPFNATRKRINSLANFVGTVDTSHAQFLGGGCMDTASCDGLRIAASVGNVSGLLRVYGIVKGP